MKKVLLVFILLLSGYYSSIACSCASHNFCTTIVQPSSQVVLSGKIISSDTNSIQLDVISVYIGTENRDTITIWSGTNIFCSGWFSMSVHSLGDVNDTIVLALDLPIAANDIQNSWDVPGDYRRPNYLCSTPSLRVSGGIVLGAITHFQANYTININSLPFTEFEAAWNNGTLDCNSFLPNYTLDFSVLNPITCFGDCDGHISVSVNGGVGPFGFSWTLSNNTVSYTSQVDSACRGYYHVTITDSSDMSTYTAGYYFSGPNSVNISFTSVVSPSSICTDCNGFVSANANGGVPPFSYSWNNGATTPSVNNLCFGTATLIVTDSRGCADTGSVFVDALPGTFSATPVITPPSACGVCDASLTLTNISGGIPPYTYSPTDSLCSGGRLITITDTNGCSGSILVTIPQGYSTLTVDTVAIQTPSYCGAQDGFITIAGAGGTPPYTYNWATNNLTGPTIAGLYTGMYLYSITDAAGCTYSGQIYLPGPNAPTIVIDSLVDIDCQNNSSAGAAYYHAVGGTGNLIFQLQHLGQFLNTGPQYTGNLVSGHYILTVRDSLNCTHYTSFDIEDYSNIYVATNSTAANCSSNGTATVSASGPYPPFTYNWSNGDTTQSLNNLSAGTYTVTVTNTLGCYRVGNVVVNDDCYNVVSGRAYVDLNQNCILDNGEPLVYNAIIQANTYYASSNTGGYYELLTHNLNNTVTATMSQNTISAVCPLGGSASVNFNQLGDTINNIDFGFDPTDADLSINHGSVAIRPGFTTYYYLSAYNYGPSSQNATLTLYYDPVLTFLTAPNGGVHNPALHTVEWNTTIASGGFISYTAYFNVPNSLNLGDTICSQATINPFIGDIDTTNNSSSYCRIVTGAYDPNMKEVYPEGNILPTDSILNYTVHFQNTGNDTAFTVIVRDTLSPYLDPLTIQPGASSHPYTFTLSGDGDMEFRFDQILLPDSNINEPESHGHFTYTIELRNNLPVGTNIHNTAHIYFDFNAPIVTNTVTNTIVDLTVGNEELSIGSSVFVYPNPFEDLTTFVIGDYITNQSYQLELYDISGKLVKAIGAITSKQFNLGSEGLDSGIYFYSIYSGDRSIGKGKLVVR